MYFQQITTPGLGCFSYIIGCPRAGVMAVADPRRDIDVYLAVAKERGMRITHIFDTHVHADHISGARELSRAGGADIYLHESAPVEYEVKKVKDGDQFKLGSAVLRVLHTPGHTPNSISLLVTDLARSEQPAMILTGDLLFVGDTGRPDLPGEKILDEQIRNLYDSLHTTLGSLPDFLEVFRLVVPHPQQAGQHEAGVNRVHQQLAQADGGGTCLPGCAGADLRQAGTPVEYGQQQAGQDEPGQLGKCEGFGEGYQQDR